MHSQVVVLGGGPGGYAAAFMAADLGLEVTLIEADSRLGGTCLLRGCIPSKALLHVAKVIGEVRDLDEWGIDFGKMKLNVDTLRARKEKVIDTLSGGLAELAKRRKVRVINARGIFVDSNTLQLEGGTPQANDAQRITFDKCILATGSVPAMPKMFNIGSKRVMDSTGALKLEDVPKPLLVIGGGYIGLEMGTVYAELGTTVSVVELTEGLLPGADRDLVKPLHKRLDTLFEKIYLDTKVLGLEDVGKQVNVQMEGSEGKFSLTFDRVLVSVGRRPVSNGLGLESTKVTVNERGFVVVNNRQETSDPSILAIGDVAGDPMLAHKAEVLAALADAPLTRIPGRAPSILFSKLAAGAHIPAHTGMLNVRLICHLPLLVPPGCVFRVGADERPWVEGKAWVFDDTIEHEAWNRSGADRYVLLFDIWRPELSHEEMAGVALLCEALDDYRGRDPWDA